jgi:hypothetical protein
LQAKLARMSGDVEHAMDILEKTLARNDVHFRQAETVLQFELGCVLIDRLDALLIAVQLVPALRLRLCSGDPVVPQDARAESMESRDGAQAPSPSDDC